jgi:undecaprenyl-phosphate 4-deoxy-4-formamido-L-arabinose transferase
VSAQPVRGSSPNPDARPPVPEISIVVPIYNEEDVLPALFQRLYPALDRLGASYEVLFVNDGSRDQSPALLAAQFEARPDTTRVILLSTNYGQHMAILAGFQYARGDVLVTLDADLQNPPEEIGALLEKMREGHDYVGSYRRNRQDTLFRRTASRFLNALRERITHIRMTDQGCMLRAYSRSIVDAINSCSEVNTFVPALAYTFARRPAEIGVAHAERAAGMSKYSLLKLAQLNFDLMTGFSITPLRAFTFVGILVSLLSMLAYAVVMVERLISAQSVDEALRAFWDRDILQFFLLGITLFGLGLLGEYVGRLYLQVRGRPRYTVDAVLERPRIESAKPVQIAAADAPAGRGPISRA